MKISLFCSRRRAVRPTWTSSVACSPMTWTPRELHVVEPKEELEEAVLVADDVAAGVAA